MLVLQSTVAAKMMSWHERNIQVLYIKELTVFALESICNFREVASVLPISRPLVDALVHPVGRIAPRVVVELGFGTGAITRHLLRHLSHNATLFAFEVNPRFRSFVSKTTRDMRLQIFPRAAEEIVSELENRGCLRIDAAISSLGMGYMSTSRRHRILLGISKLMRPHGVFTHYQYAHGLEVRRGRLGRFGVSKLLGQYFGTVRQRLVWGNLPPAYVYEATGPRLDGGAE